MSPVVHRFTKGKSGIEADFYDEITSFSSKAKKWHVHYFESDCESEDLNVNDVLRSLRDTE